MHTHSVRKNTFRLGLMIVMLLLFIAESVVTRAADAVSIQLSFDQLFPLVGSTHRLGISITNLTPDAIRVTKFQCIPDSTSIVGESISQLPSTIAANGSFQTSQYYHVVAPGTVTIHCELTGTDLVTHQTISVISAPSDTIEVNPETRLSYEVYSASHVATVGQAVFVEVVFSNHGNVTFTDIDQSCTEFGNEITFTSKTPIRTTLPPGQTQSAEYRGIAVSKGTAGIGCVLFATDPSTGVRARIFSSVIQIVVK